MHTHNIFLKKGTGKRKGWEKEDLHFLKGEAHRGKGADPSLMVPLHWWAGDVREDQCRWDRSGVRWTTGSLSDIRAHRVATAWSSVFPPLWLPHSHTPTLIHTPTYSCSHINMYTQTHDTPTRTHIDICTHYTGSYTSHTIHIHTFPHPYIPTVTHIHMLSHTTGHSHLCTHSPLSHTQLHRCESGKVIYYVFWGFLIPLELGSNSLAWHLRPGCHVEFQHVYAALPSPTPLSLQSPLGVYWVTSSVGREALRWTLESGPLFPYLPSWYTPGAAWGMSPIKTLPIFTQAFVFPVLAVLPVGIWPFLKTETKALFCASAPNPFTQGRSLPNRRSLCPSHVPHTSLPLKLLDLFPSLCLKTWRSVIFVGVVSKNLAL